MVTRSNNQTYGLLIMSIKVVTGIINKKVNDWLASIEDVPLRESIANNIIVSGGCITSLLQGEKVNDYDVYFQDRAVLIETMKYYLERFAKNPPPKFRNGDVVKMFVDERKSYPRCIIKSQGVAGEQKEEDDPKKLGYAYFETQPAADATAFVSQVTEGLKTELMDLAEDHAVESEEPSHVNLIKEAIAEEIAPKATGPGAATANKYRPIFISTNAITLSDSIQIVTRFYGTPELIHKNFDFVHCTQYYVHSERKVVTNEAALLSIQFKELYYVGSLYPLCSLIRIRKFIKRGWNINAGQIVKMAFQVKDLDLYDVNVLEEQLIGVDAAYFHQVIEIIKAGVKAGHPLDQNYVVEVINKLF